VCPSPLLPPHFPPPVGEEVGHCRRAAYRPAGWPPLSAAPEASGGKSGRRPRRRDAVDGTRNACPTRLAAMSAVARP